MVEMPDGQVKRLVLFPEWGGEERVPHSIPISRELRERVHAWNLTWQTVLDPVIEVSWPDPKLGRQWIAEGNAIVAALKEEIGTSIEIEGDFLAYDPDVTRTPGSTAV